MAQPHKSAIWLQEPAVLINPPLDFIPKQKHTLEERYNAFSRSLLVLSFFIFFFRKTSNTVTMAIIVLWAWTIDQGTKIPKLNQTSHQATTNVSRLGNKGSTVGPDITGITLKATKEDTDQLVYNIRESASRSMVAPTTETKIYATRPPVDEPKDGFSWLFETNTGPGKFWSKRM